MKVLLIVTPLRHAGPPPVEVMTAVKSWVNEKVQNKTFDCVFGIVSHGGGVAIANIDSAEDLAKTMAEYPGAAAVSWDVEILADINTHLQLTEGMIRRTMAS